MVRECRIRQPASHVRVHRLCAYDPSSCRWKLGARSWSRAARLVPAQGRVLLWKRRGSRTDFRAVATTAGDRDRRGNCRRPRLHRGSGSIHPDPAPLHHFAPLLHLVLDAPVESSGVPAGASRPNQAALVEPGTSFTMDGCASGARPRSGRCCRSPACSHRAWTWRPGRCRWCRPRPPRSSPVGRPRRQPGLRRCSTTGRPPYWRLDIQAARAESR